MIQVYDKYGKIKSSGLPGSGTVTSFSAGDLSPIFTSTITSPTSTPNISFSKISQTQNLFYASPNGSSGLPTFRALVAADIPTLTNYVPTSRTLTINGVTYDLSSDRSWTVTASGAAWGSITGTLTAQTDLTLYLSTNYFPIPSGAISQYIDGTGALQTFPTIPTVGTWGALNYPTWTTGTPFVKMTAAGAFALDTNTYLTGITSGQVTTALGYTPVTNARTITINGTTFDLTADRSWTIATGSGTVTSVAALTLNTSGTDLSSTVATGTTTPVITLNVPTASATNRGALSSADWTRFDGIDSTRKLLSSATGSVTGTTAETILTTLTIAANTLDTRCFIWSTLDYFKTNSGACTLRLYVNSSNSLSGATLIGLSSIGSNRNLSFNRKLYLNGTTLDFLVSNTGASQVSNEFVEGLFTASTTLTVNPSNNIFLIYTTQNDAVGTVATNKMATVQKMKLN